MTQVLAGSSSSSPALPRLAAAAFAPAEVALLKTFAQKSGTKRDVLDGDTLNRSLVERSDEEGAFIAMVWGGQGGIVPAQIAALRASGFDAPVLTIFDLERASEDLISSFFEAGSDEVLRLPRGHAILAARLRAMWLRYRAHSELMQAHKQMKDILSFIRHDLASPLSTLQMSINGLARLDRNSEKFDQALARCERSVAKMVETLRGCQTRFRPANAGGPTAVKPDVAKSS